MRGRIAGSICAALLGWLAPFAGLAPAFEQAALPAHPVIDLRQTMPERVAFGEPVVVEVRVTNRGTAPAENVTVSGSLPPFHQLIEAVPPPERIRENLMWPLGNLEPGAERVIRLWVKLAAGAPKPEVQSCLRVSYLTTLSQTCTAAVQHPELTLKVAGPREGVVGETATLHIAVHNQGGGPAHDVTLQTVLPAGLSHPGGPDLENDLGVLQAGESRTVVLPVTLTQAGEIRDRIRVFAPGVDPVEQTICLSVREVKLNFVAHVPQLLYKNWPGSFELIFRNEGGEPIPQVGVVAGLPEGMAFVRASDNAVYDAATHSLYWNLGELKAGEERTLVWNGVATRTGDLQGKAMLAMGGKPFKEVTWKTTVPQAAGNPVSPPPPSEAGEPRDASASRLPLPVPPEESHQWHSLSPAPQTFPATFRDGPVLPSR
jgi:uncharacterized repeat protein (TIGR01451 family)